MGSDVYGLPSRETYPDSQNLRSDAAKIRSIFESSKYFGTFLLQYDFSCKVLLYFLFYLYLCIKYRLIVVTRRCLGRRSIESLWLTNNRKYGSNSDAMAVYYHSRSSLCFNLGNICR